MRRVCVQSWRLAWRQFPHATSPPNISVYFTVWNPVPYFLAPNIEHPRCPFPRPSSSYFLLSTLYFIPSFQASSMVPPPVEGCGVAPPLAQKASEEFRAAWSEYCQYVAGNSRDPAPGPAPRGPEKDLTFEDVLEVSGVEESVCFLCSKYPSTSLQQRGWVGKPHHSLYFHLYLGWGCNCG